MPPDGVLGGVASLPGGMVWGDPVERPRSAYAPSYAPELGTMHTVLARFRRGDSLLVVAPFRFEPRDTSEAVAGPGTPEGGECEHRRDVQAGLFLVPWAETAGEMRPPAAAHAVGHAVRCPSWYRWAATCTAWKPSTAGPARERVFGGIWSLGPHPDDIPDLSDFLIIEAPDRAPGSVDDIDGPCTAVPGCSAGCRSWRSRGRPTGSGWVKARIAYQPRGRAARPVVLPAAGRVPGGARERGSPGAGVERAESGAAGCALPLRRSGFQKPGTRDLRAPAGASGSTTGLP